MDWILVLFGCIVYLSWLVVLQRRVHLRNLDETVAHAVPHNAMSTETATPVDSQEEIIVKGYVNYYGTTILRIIMEEVTWYDARDICEHAGFGKLDNSSHYHMKTSMITAALEEFGIGSNSSLSLWTSYFRPDVTSEDWVSVCNEDLCYSSELALDTAGENDQCVVNTYISPFQDPLLETKNCSEKFSFVCVRWDNAATNFTKYTGHDLVSDPANSTLMIEFLSDFLSCINICAGNGFCVGASHNDVTGECRRVNAVYGFQYLQYPIVYVGSAVSHYTKAGIDVILIETSNYASERIVDQHFECPPDLEATTPVWGSSSTTTTPTSVDSGGTEEITYPTTDSTSQKTGEVSVSSTNGTTTPSPTSSTSSETVSTSTVLSTVMISSSTTTGNASQTSATLSRQSNSRTTTNTHTTLTTTSPDPLRTTSLSTSTTSAYCACNFTMCQNSAPLNETEITELVQMLVQNLTVARKETFKFKSMLVCSEDNRTSARAMGYVAAIVMCFVFGPIFISDIIQLFGTRW